MDARIDASDALVRAAGAEAAALRGSGWYARYLWVLAGGQVVLVPMALLWRGLLAALVFAVLNCALIGGLSAYAARQTVVRRGFGARHGGVIAGWATAFAVTVALGVSTFEGSVPFAVAGTLWCALPLAVVAIREGRRTA
ncbi:hypothetical protein [Streptomyces sp. NPDC048057]|uniref:hypothetical protein n=1 Tax=Streptomyces sp. NPDC048057 TaxID=3155628 RepID=UPI0033EF3526